MKRNLLRLGLLSLLLVFAFIAKAQKSLLFGTFRKIFLKVSTLQLTFKVKRATSLLP